MLDDPSENETLIREATMDLASMGLNEPAAQLRDAHQGTYTTGSEYLGELRRAAKTIRSAHRLPRELDAKLKRLLRPSFSERVVVRQMWQGVLVATILAMFGASIVLIVTARQWRGFGFVWIAAAALVLVVLWIAVRRASACPGCGTRNRAFFAWCPHCGTNLAAGTSGPQVATLPIWPKSTLLECPKCGKPPGGRSRYGTPFPSEGHFCGSCGTRLPDG